jgi:hypothetical protein
MPAEPTVLPARTLRRPTSLGVQHPPTRSLAEPCDPDQLRAETWPPTTEHIMVGMEIRHSPKPPAHVGKADRTYLPSPGRASATRVRANIYRPWGALR